MMLIPLIPLLTSFQLTFAVTQLEVVPTVSPTVLDTITRHQEDMRVKMDAVEGSFDGFRTSNKPTSTVARNIKEMFERLQALQTHLVEVQDIFEVLSRNYRDSMNRYTVSVALADLTAKQHTVVWMWTQIQSHLNNSFPRQAYPVERLNETCQHLEKYYHTHDTEMSLHEKLIQFMVKGRSAELISQLQVIGQNRKDFADSLNRSLTESCREADKQGKRFPSGCFERFTSKILVAREEGKQLWLNVNSGAVSSWSCLLLCFCFCVTATGHAALV